jgi:hypothetical protein
MPAVEELLAVALVARAGVYYLFSVYAVEGQNVP